MNVCDVVKVYLIAAGYDGLYSARNDCSCEVSDLMPCMEEGIGQCEAGYKHFGCTDYCGMGCDFHIMADKPALRGPTVGELMGGE